MTLLVWQQEEHPACNKCGCYHTTNNKVCCWWCYDWSFVHFIAAVVTTTSIVLSSNKLDNPGTPGKWPLKWRERDRDRANNMLFWSYALVLLQMLTIFHFFLNVGLCSKFPAITLQP